MDDWLDENAAAQWLNLPERELRQALQTGELPALRIGKRWRINKGILIDLARGGQPAGPSLPTLAVAPDPADGPNDDADPSAVGRLQRPAGFGWTRRLGPGTPWTQHWPQGHGKPDILEENTKAWEGLIELEQKTLRVKIGECLRPVTLATGEQVRRGRLGIWLDNYPTVEFAETADGAGWASLIKPDTRTTLAVGATPPPLYRGARLDSYKAVTGMAGQGVRNGMALVIDRTDLDSAVYHAAARWLARSGYPVVPASTQKHEAA